MKNINKKINSILFARKLETSKYIIFKLNNQSSKNKEVMTCIKYAFKLEFNKNLMFPLNFKNFDNRQDFLVYSQRSKKDILLIKNLNFYYKSLDFCLNYQDIILNFRKLLLRDMSKLLLLLNKI